MLMLPCVPLYNMDSKTVLDDIKNLKMERRGLAKTEDDASSKLQQRGIIPSTMMCSGKATYTYGTPAKAQERS